jgi:hypothetical protein
MDVGMVGGVAGGVLGLAGAAIGTFVSVVNTRGPRERAYMVRLAALGWLWVAVLVAWLLLAPSPWNRAAVLLTLPPLLSIPWLNRGLARARTEDQPRV